MGQLNRKLPDIKTHDEKKDGFILHPQTCPVCKEHLNSCVCNKENKVPMVRIFSRYYLHESGSIEVPLSELPDKHCSNCSRFPTRLKNDICGQCVNFNQHCKCKNVVLNMKVIDA